MSPFRCKAVFPWTATDGNTGNAGRSSPSSARRSNVHFSLFFVYYLQSLSEIQFPTSRLLPHKMSRNEPQYAVGTTKVVPKCCLLFRLVRPILDGTDKGFRMPQRESDKHRKRRQQCAKDACMICGGGHEALVFLFERRSSLGRFHFVDSSKNSRLFFCP